MHIHIFFLLNIIYIVCYLYQNIIHFSCTYLFGTIFSLTSSSSTQVELRWVLSGIKNTNVVASVHPTWSPPHFAATKFEYKYKRSRGRVISSDGKRRWAEVIKGRLRHEENFHLTGLHVGPQPASVRISRGFRLASPRWGRGGYSAEGWRLKREESGGGSHPPIRVLLRCWLQ